MTRIVLEYLFGRKNHKEITDFESQMTDKRMDKSINIGLSSYLGFNPGGGLMPQLITAVIGAVLLVWIYKKVVK